MDSKYLLSGLLFLTIFIFLTIDSTNLVKSQNLDEKFVYVTQSNAGDDILIHFANPYNLSADLIYPIQISGDFVLGEVEINSTRTYLSLIILDGQSSRVLLINLLNLDSEIVSSEIIFPSPPNLFMDNVQRIYWSPNGEYFATIEVSENGQDVFLYSVQDHTWVNFTNNDDIQYQIGWSSDSTRIAMYETLCLTDCPRNLSVYDISQGSKVSSVSVGNILTGLEGADSTLCKISWSPNDLYISFMAGCDGTVLSSAREIHLFAVNQGIVSTLTDYNDTPVNTFDPYLFANYFLYWISPDELLISSFWKRNQPQFETETIIYRPSTGDHNIVSSSYLPDFSLSNNETLFYEVTYQSNNGRQVSPIRIGSLQNSQLVTNHILEIGCNPLWSPSANVIVYSTNTSPDYFCDSSINKFEFVDSNGSGIRQIEVSLNDIVRIGGWVSQVNK
ncbi:MAG: hypothetical protein RIC84_28565 [Aggregatilineales bacterium]